MTTSHGPCYTPAMTHYGNGPRPTSHTDQLLIDWLDEWRRCRQTDYLLTSVAFGAMDYKGEEVN